MSREKGVVLGQDCSFINTVPMQHVQSHYTNRQRQPLPSSKIFGDTPASSSGACLQTSAGWGAQLTTQPFAALLALSPESSDESMHAHT